MSFPMSESQRLRREAAQDRRRIAELEKEVERLDKENAEMHRQLLGAGETFNKMKAEVARLEWMRNELLTDSRYDVGNRRASDVLADLSARYEEWG